MIDPASFLEEAAGLMEVKGHAVFVTLHSGDDDPSIVTESGSLPGFSPAGDTFDLIVVLFQILFDMDFLKHRFVNDFFVADRKIQKDGETPVRLVLVLTGAADVDVLISIAPVRGKAFVEPLRAFGDEIEREIRAFPHHLPGFGTLGIGVRMKEVRGEAGHDRAVFRLQLVVPMTVFFDRKAERGCFLYNGGVLAELGITPVNIAVSASGTAFGAAVPWVPERHGRLLSQLRSRVLAGTILSRSGDSIRRAGSPHTRSGTASRFHIDRAFSDPL